MTPLTSKTILITGGGRGYGREMALAIAKAGANVAVVGRTAAEVEAVAASITAAGGQSLGLTADVRDDSQVGEMVRRVEDRFGAVDALINNAGIPGPNDKVAAIGDGDWCEVIDINLNGAFRAASAVLPGMIERRSGHIVNVSSGTARLGFRNVRSVAYATSKFAIEGFSSALAVELEPFDIRVNAFTPGVAETRFVDGVPKGYLSGMQCQTPDHVGPPIVHVLTTDVPTGESFQALAWLDTQGLLEDYSYIHD